MYSIYLLWTRNELIGCKKYTFASITIKTRKSETIQACNEKIQSCVFNVSNFVKLSTRTVTRYVKT